MENQNQITSAPTFESVWAALMEDRAYLHETGHMVRETDRLMKETDRRMKETDRQMKALQKELGGISNSNGEMAEAYFYNALRRDKTFVNEKFDKIQKNRSIRNGTVEAEFDIVLFNGTSAAIIEVKYTANRKNISVREMIAKVAPFKMLYPAYKNCNIYLGVAALSFKGGMEKRLHRNGIATIRQVGKKMVVYDKEVKVFF